MVLRELATKAWANIVQFYLNEWITLTLITLQKPLMQNVINEKYVYIDKADILLKASLEVTVWMWLLLDLQKCLFYEPEYFIVSWIMVD